MREYKGINFNRRVLFKITAFIYIFRYSKLSQGLAAPNLKNYYNTKYYTKSWELTPKSNIKKFLNEDQFWNAHRDDIAYDLNAYFRSQGWLVEVKSKFLSKSNSIILQKVYKNHYFYHLYNHLWSKISNGEKQEPKNLFVKKSNLFIG